MMTTDSKHKFTLDPSKPKPPTRDDDAHSRLASTLPEAQESRTNVKAGGEDTNATLRFIGTATTILEWNGVRIMTDPNFLHAGDHVHLGPGVTGTRLTNPAVELEHLPAIDLVLLSHYHADHFDQVVEERLRRDLPIVTTPHAREHLHDKKDDADKFTSVYDLDFFESAILHIRNASAAKPGSEPAVKVTGMPGKHVPPGPLSVVNDFLGAVPPTNGWMLELGHSSSAAASSPASESFETGYRIYISGDTLLVDELQDIPKRYAGEKIDLMLIHLGGTTIPGPKAPLLMVTMDATQGVQLMQLIKPELTIPIHYDDYDVFLSPLDDFKKAVTSAGWDDKVVYLDRGEEFRFKVR